MLENFIKNYMYVSNTTVTPVNTSMSVVNSTVPGVTPDEAIFAFKDEKRGKAPREDGLLKEVLRNSGLKVDSRTFILSMHTLGVSLNHCIIQQ